MKVGDLVTMKDCNLNIIGLIVEAFLCDLSLETVYKIEWQDDMCDTSFATEGNMEVISESR